jgi:hypothetical protein
VNSHANRSAPILQLLLEHGAAVDIRLPGITRGKGCEWETTCFDVTLSAIAPTAFDPM